MNTESQSQMTHFQTFIRFKFEDTQTRTHIYIHAEAHELDEHTDIPT